jgi:hypothetical protein
MGDLSCPTCGLVLYGSGVGRLSPRHCPRCVALSRRLVALVEVTPDRQTPEIRIQRRTVQTQTAPAGGADQRTGDQDIAAP